MQVYNGDIIPNWNWKAKTWGIAGMSIIAKTTSFIYKYINLYIYINDLIFVNFEREMSLIIPK